MRQLRKLKFFTSLLFLLASNIGHANFDCQDLIGSWSNERFDKTLDKDRRTIETISDDGSFWIKFIYSDGDEITEREEHGTWECHRDSLTISYNETNNRPEKFVTVYQIIALDKTHYKLRARNSNCENNYGDCGSDIIYEYFRVIN